MEREDTGSEASARQPKTMAHQETTKDQAVAGAQKPAKKTAVARDKGASFLRAFSVLEAVVDSNSPVTVSYISKTVGLPVATVHRLCKMLVEQRLLQYEIDGKRLLSGPRMFEFATRILSGSHYDLERRIIMETLVEEVGETCNISIPDGMRMIYAERVESHWPLRVQLPVGSHVPMHCTASGKLYLSHLGSATADRILGRLELTKHTPRSIASVKALKSELAEIRKRGYSTDDEEFIEGLVAIAVPIVDPNGRFCAGLALHGPKYRITLESALDRLPALQRAAQQIGELMRNHTAEPTET